MLQRMIIPHGQSAGNKQHLSRVQHCGTLLFHPSNSIAMRVDMGFGTPTNLTDFTRADTGLCSCARNPLQVYLSTLHLQLLQAKGIVEQLSKSILAPPRLTGKPAVNDPYLPPSALAPPKRWKQFQGCLNAGQ